MVMNNSPSQLYLSKDEASEKGVSKPNFKKIADAFGIRN